MKVKNSKGFTLIEILIAVAILASIAVSMSEMSSNIISTQERGGLHAERRQMVGLALSKIMDDLRTAFLADRAFHGKNGTYQTGFVGEQDSMNFASMSNVHYIKNHKDTDQIHVGYRLERADNGEYNLIRRSSDYLLEDIEEGGQSLVLLDDVRELKIEYYDANKKEWKDRWDTSSVSFASRLPRMVKLTLTTLRPKKDAQDQRDREEWVFQTIVPIEMYKQKISF